MCPHFFFWELFLLTSVKQVVAVRIKRGLATINRICGTDSSAQQRPKHIDSDGNAKGYGKALCLRSSLSPFQESLTGASK